MRGGWRGAAFTIADQSQPGHARRAGSELAARLGFDPTEAGRVELAVTELATNLLRHAGEGEVLLRPLEEAGSRGLEVLALDRGPGIPNVAESLRDGYSTGGTPGTGLGAVRRLSARFDIYSVTRQGTAVLAQFWGGQIPEARSGRRLDVGAVCLPRAGEAVSGDDWVAERSGAHDVIAVVDGLGHGPLAAEASCTATRLVSQHAGAGPRSSVTAVHAGLRSTRGGAVAVAAVDLGRNLVRFCGLGNVGAAVVAGDRIRRLVSHDGTAGHTAARIDEFTYPWWPGGLLILHSDGLASHWDLDRYPGLSRRHPSLVAGVLYRDFTRKRDDVTVVVARESVE